MLGARLRASVEADENGAMDMRSLEQVVGVARRSMDISRFVVVCTLGTTFRGASDDVRGVLRVLHAVGIEREHVHIHVDAAQVMLPRTAHFDMLELGHLLPRFTLVKR